MKKDVEFRIFLPTLKDRRIRGDMIEAYKILSRKYVMSMYIQKLPLYLIH